MLDARLPLALDGGGLEWPEEGTIAVFGPPVEADLDRLPKDRVQIIEGFKPWHDAWVARGYDTVCEVQGQYAACVVSLPRAKAQARAVIAQACAVSLGPVVIDGQKTDGAESLFREIRGRVTVQDAVSKAHGKLFWITAEATGQFADWAAGPVLTEAGFWTAPGVFSADGVDLASALLVEAMPAKLGAQVADLGAGWGYLAAHAMTRREVEAVHLVEASHIALECARRNVTDARARFHWADVPSWTPPHRVDCVLMNPPFHTGRAAEPQIGQAFVATAARILARSGELWMVANRHLPYEAELKTHFGEVEELGGDARFKLFHAARPTGGRR